MAENNNFDLNDLIKKAKNANTGKGIKIPKKTETEDTEPKKQIPKSTSKRIDEHLQESDELIEVIESSDTKTVDSIKRAYGFQQTGVMPTLEDIMIATGTKKPTPKEKEPKSEESVNEEVKSEKPGLHIPDFSNITLEEIDKLGQSVDRDNLPQEETNDLIAGKEIRVMEIKKKEEEVEPEEKSISENKEEKVLDKKEVEKIPESAKKEEVPIDKIASNATPNVVVIEKHGDGELQFTDEEKEKLLNSEYIEVREIKSYELPTKVTKCKKGDIGSIIERRRKKFTADITPFVSGYVATVKALTPGEILDIIYPNGENEVQQQIYRWTKIYDCIVRTSIGKMSFDEFCHNTSPLDYNLFLLGILIATYGAESQFISFICRKKEHGEEGYKFNVDLDYRSIMQVDDLDERAIELIMKIADASTDVKSAKKAQLEAPLTQRKQFVLEDSGIHVVLQLDSVYDHLTRNLEAIQAKQEENGIVNTRFSVIAKYIQALYVPTENDEYIMIDELEDIIDFMRTMEPDEIEIISNRAIKLLEGLDVTFGIKDVRCPVCGDLTPFVEINLQDELFTRASQSKQKKFV